MESNQKQKIEHMELQQNFMSIVHKMIESKCELPKEFELFYAVNVTSNREGRFISAKPCLTKDMALKECGEDMELGTGKYWETSHDEVVCPEGNIKHALYYKMDLCML